MNAKSLFKTRINNEERPENDKVNVVNQKYLAVSYKFLDYIWLKLCYFIDIIRLSAT